MSLWIQASLLGYNNYRRENLIISQGWHGWRKKCCVFLLTLICQQQNPPREWSWSLHPCSPWWSFCVLDFRPIDTQQCWLRFFDTLARGILARNEVWPLASVVPSKHFSCRLQPLKNPLRLQKMRKSISGCLHGPWNVNISSCSMRET
jgi:hypothetical protein